MTLYVVRCNFADPANEEAWQRWYSGPKQDWLLSRPLFVAGQRFESVWSTDGVRFLAAYILESPSALETDEYLSSWGWAEWKPSIVDWSRDLFAGFEPADVLTGDSEQLHVVFVGADADLSAARDAYPDHVWGALEQPIDGRLSALAVRRISSPAAQPVTSVAGCHEAVFRPVSPARYADGA